jgi:hypothetical protein
MDVISAGGFAVADRLVSLLELHVTNWTFALDGISLEAFGRLSDICERSCWRGFEDIVKLG